ncbi:PTS galactitol transporter subunit IIB [Spirochaetia bacterium]|nr:PTS galactitol transporter subunit IIB [Spirochaetia bacterium]
MKKIMLVCGTGIATSTAVNVKLTDILNKRGYEGKFKTYQFKTGEAVANSSNYDFCVATTQVPDGMQCPLIKGVPFLTGINLEPVIQSIIAELEK